MLNILNVLFGRLQFVAIKANAAIAANELRVELSQNWF